MTITSDGEILFKLKVSLCMDNAQHMVLVWANAMGLFWSTNVFNQLVMLKQKVTFLAQFEI